MYCGSAGNWCLTKCTFEVQHFLGRDIGVESYVMVPRYASAKEMVAVVGEVVTGVLVVQKIGA